jgi:hypothetical protein
MAAIFHGFHCLWGRWWTPAGGGHGRPTSLLPAGPYLGGHQMLVLISTIAARILCSTFSSGFRTSLLC